MEFVGQNIEIMQQYKQGFAIRQEKKKKEEKAPPSTDITTKQWFWDKAVIS
jgi:hypothetical protein